jgi:hypothetical protein
MISPNNSELYKIKLEYQTRLTQLASKEDKQNLLRTATYDLKEAIDLKNYKELKSLITLL